jgi:AraC-like DNA-binding protein/ligand-binding sensor protein
MISYIISTAEFNKILKVLTSIFNLQFTFFDLEHKELKRLENKGMSDYCRTLRSDEDFNQRCIACDRKHLTIALKTKAIQIYKCHIGLAECIIPLHGEYGVYLGSLMFGQIRLLPDEERKGGAFQKESCLPEPYQRLPRLSREYIQNIARLLKYFAVYILNKQVIKYRNKTWAERLEIYISENLNQRISLDQLAQFIHKSPSFVSKHFKEEFGLSYKAYLTKKKMEIACRMLSDGFAMKQISYELGFYDEFHFSKAFKKLYGACPSQYLSTRLTTRAR